MNLPRIFLMRKRDIFRVKVTQLRHFMIRNTMIKIRVTKKSLVILSENRVEINNLTRKLRCTLQRFPSCAILCIQREKVNENTDN